MAFGLNRGELLTRQGFSPTVNFPRVLGIECVGIVEEEKETRFDPGQKVVATTGGMGRAFDGSYAEYVSVSENNVYPVETKLSWAQLAAIPEVFHTAWGALELSLNIQENETLLVRGGSSAVGMVAADYANQRGLKVISTTRDHKKFSRLKNPKVFLFKKRLQLDDCFFKVERVELPSNDVQFPRKFWREFFPV